MVRQTVSELLAFVLIPAVAATVAVCGFLVSTFDARAAENPCVAPVTEQNEAASLRLLEPFYFKASGPAVDGTSLLYNFIAIGCDGYQVYPGGAAPQGA